MVESCIAGETFILRRLFNDDLILQLISLKKSLFKKIPGIVKRSGARSKNIFKDKPGYNIRS